VGHHYRFTLYHQSSALLNTAIPIPRDFSGLVERTEKGKDKNSTNWAREIDKRWLSCLGESIDCKKENLFKEYNARSSEGKENTL